MKKLDNHNMQRPGFRGNQSAQRAGSALMSEKAFPVNRGVDPNLKERILKDEQRIMQLKQQ